MIVQIDVHTTHLDFMLSFLIFLAIDGKSVCFNFHFFSLMCAHLFTTISIDMILFPSNLKKVTRSNFPFTFAIVSKYKVTFKGSRLIDTRNFTMKFLVPKLASSFYDNAFKMLCAHHAQARVLPVPNIAEFALFSDLEEVVISFFNSSIFLKRYFLR